MAKLPSQGFFVAGPGGTKSSDAANALNDIRDVAAQLPGGWAPESLTIATGVIAPTSASVVVDTEGGASTDDLERIDPSNMFSASDAEAGRILLLRIADASRRVVLKNALGGNGQIVTQTGGDVRLDDPAVCVVLQWHPGNTSWTVLGYFSNGKPVSLRWTSSLEDGIGLRHERSNGESGVGLVRKTSTAVPVGRVGFRGLNSSSAEVEYAAVRGEITSGTAGSHSGRLILSVSSGGASTDMLTADGQRVSVGGGALKLPSGAAPATPQSGDLRWNGTKSVPEYWNGSTWTGIAGRDPDLVQSLSLGSGGAQVLSVTHNFGSYPSHYEVSLECVTPEFGYQAGDRIDIRPVMAGSANVNAQVVLRTDSILVTMRKTPKINRLDNIDGDPVTITLANWVLTVRLWK